MSVVHTHCPYCSLNCGLGLSVKRPEGVEVVVGIERWKKSPLTAGALCAKGATAAEQIHHPERLTAPLLRQGSALVEVSWEEALDAAAAGFRRVAARLGPGGNAVMGGGSLTNEMAYLMGKFARLALRTPHIDVNGRMCMTSAGAANVGAFGADRAMLPLDDLRHAEVVVIIGANLSSTYPVVIPKMLADVRRRGGRVVVVDPRAGRFVDGSDLWLALRPGTDAVVANGVLRELGRIGGIDDPWCASRTTGLGDALAAAEPWTPERVEEVADVPSGKVRALAALLAGARNVMYLHARGMEQQVGGTQNVRSWINLALARGHVGRPGAGIAMLTGQRNGQGGREHGQRCDQLPSGRSIDDPADRAVVAQRWGVQPDDIPDRGLGYVEAFSAAARGEIGGMLMASTNPMVSAPDLAHTRRAMERMEHVVVIDPFLSETAVLADVVFPGTTFGEQEGTITTIEGRVIRVDAAIPPLGGRSEIDILRNLANRLGARRHFSFVRGREVFEELRAVSAGGPVDYAGITWERLRRDGGVFWPCPTEDHPGTPHLYTQRFAHADGLARFAAVEWTPPTDPTDSEFPLVLTTGRVLHHYLSGAQTRRIPAQLAKVPVPVLEVHPRTAAERGLEEGCPVRLRSRRGEVEVAWAPNEDLRPDTLFLPYHWPVANWLTAADQLDDVSRIPNLKVTAVSLEALTAATAASATSAATSSAADCVAPSVHPVSCQPSTVV